LTGKPHLEKPNMINHHLVVFIQHNPGELRRILSWAFEKFELSLFRVDSIQTKPHGGVLCLNYNFVYFWFGTSEERRFKV